MNHDSIVLPSCVLVLLMKLKMSHFCVGTIGSRKCLQKEWPVSLKINIVVRFFSFKRLFDKNE